MCDRAFFAGVDLGRRPRLEQKGRHVLGQERACLGIHYVQAVVVDQHRLLLEPVTPALRADPFYDAGADGARERRLHESCARLPAPHAGYSLRHAAYLRAYEISARPKMERSLR